MAHDREEDLNRILNLLTNSQEPLSQLEMRQVLGNRSRNTVARRITTLMDSGLVEPVGSGRFTKYTLVKTNSFEVRVPVGLDAEDIDAYVSLPVNMKMNVGYQHSFLDSYRPNVSQYLPDTLLKKLHDCGRLRGNATYRSHDSESLRVQQRFLIDVSHASSKLEGIDTDYFRTERLLRMGGKATTKEDSESIRLILNHKVAIEFVLEYMLEDKEPIPIGFNRFTVTNVHGNLTHGLLANPDSVCRVRRIAVGIQGSSYSPIDIPVEVESTLDQVLETCAQIEDPFEQSFFALAHLSYLQPCEDGNKRTARIMANIPLLKANLCPISFLGVPTRAYMNGVLGVYEMNRIELLKDAYVSSYQQNSPQFHGERGRTLTQSSLSLRYHREINRVIRSLVENTPLDPLKYIGEWTSGYEGLTSSQRRDLRDIVVEQCRILSPVTANVFRIDPDKYREWERDRIVYSERINLPSKVMKLTDSETPAKGAGLKR